MSRSRKKPYWTDNGSSAIMKKKVNRKLRKNKKEMADYGAYKRVYESWDICDWRFYDPKSAKAYRK